MSESPEKPKTLIELVQSLSLEDQGKIDFLLNDLGLGMDNLENADPENTNEIFELIVDTLKSEEKITPKSDKGKKLYKAIVGA